MSKYREHVASADFQRKILSIIPMGRDNAISTSDLMRLLNCSRRSIKKAILQLRVDHPVCSKDTGGYWIADCDEDIISFNNILKARCDTQLETIQKMTQHIGGGI